jgi:hypothetical protein
VAISLDCSHLDQIIRDPGWQNEEDVGPCFVAEVDARQEVTPKPGRTRFPARTRLDQLLLLSLLPSLRFFSTMPVDDGAEKRLLN